VEIAGNGHRVVRREGAEVVGPVALDPPEPQEPIAPAWRGGDEHGRLERPMPRGEHESMHRPEVVTDKGDRCALGQADRQAGEGRTEAPLLQLEVGDVRGGVDRVGLPRQPARRQHAAHASPRVVMCLGQELGPIAPTLAQPVQEQDSCAHAPIDGLDDVCLDTRFAAAEDRVGDADARRRRSDRACHAGHCAGPSECRAYDQRVLELDAPTLRLTDLTTCGGCAAKLGADALEAALAGLGIDDADLPHDGSSGLIAGLHPPDDAAVHVVAPGVAVIGTLDFFPPIVDDPRTFGEIAAANALSDVFAMGGRVLFALSVAAMPEDMPTAAFRAILDGAAAKVREAGGILAGGHTIRDPEPKYGLAVIGVASPERLLRKGGAQPGDLLILTKPLGTGLLVSGERQGRTSTADLERAVDQMRMLNRTASEILVAHGVRGATDVTGFGLLGHGLEMARASRTTFAFDAGRLPALDGALDLARAGVETGGAAHNRRFVAPYLTLGPDVAPELVTLAHDPQTSGGLLAAIPPAAVSDVHRHLVDAGLDEWAVGHVEASDEPRVVLR
jgi:selenide, water dikinase